MNITEEITKKFMGDLESGKLDLKGLVSELEEAHTEGIQIAELVIEFVNIKINKAMEGKDAKTRAMMALEVLEQLATTFMANIMPTMNKAFKEEKMKDDFKKMFENRMALKLNDIFEKDDLFLTTLKMR